MSRSRGLSNLLYAFAGASKGQAPKGRNLFPGKRLDSRVRAETKDDAMNGSPISLLMFGTLAIVVIVGIVLLLRHLRKPGNRHPMDGERERNIDEIRRDGPG